MSIAYSDAIDQIFNTFLVYWNSNIGSVGLSYTPEIKWENVEELEPPNTAEHYLMVSHQNISERQITLQNVKKLYETIGFVKIQFYFSKATLVKGDDKVMTPIARDAFRKAPSSDVWYRDSRIIKFPSEEDYYRADVISNYTYSESM